MRYLILLAHADDESLGVGGSIPYLIEQGHELQLMIVSNGIVSMRDSQDDNRQALMDACEILGIQDVNTLNFPDQAFELQPQAEIARAVRHHLPTLPDVIITHSASDLNLDHRIVHQVAKIIGRPRQKPIGILACEIPSVARWNGQNFSPTYYNDITAYIDQKIDAFSCYHAENKPFPDPYSAEGLRTLAKFRGMEAGFEAAEAFEVIRWYG